MTSKDNLEYTKGLGLYDEVVTYEDIPSLALQKIAIQDVAGSGSVRGSLYRHFGNLVVYCGMVGMAHAGSAGRPAPLTGLGGAAPVGFLVFTALEEVVGSLISLYTLPHHAIPLFG